MHRFYSRYDRTLNTLLHEYYEINITYYVINTNGKFSCLHFLKPIFNLSTFGLTETSTSEMLVNLGSANLEEFYPAVVLSALMRIMRDPALSNHHTTVIQAIQFIYSSLGMKGVQYLPQLMPSYLNVIRTCDPSFREVILILNIVLIFIVKIRFVC